MPDGECVMLRDKRQSGQALVAATVGLVALLAATGLAIDVGYLRYQKRLQQSAADSAALAGAAELKFGGSGGYKTAAQQDSSLNGFTDGVNNVTVTPSNPPSTGPNSTDNNSVEVIVSAVQPTFFMKIVGVNSTTLTARAVAKLTGGGSRGCLYTLGLGGAGGITTNGTASIDAPNCGILDDSTLTKNGSGHITAASIGTVGAVTDHGGGAITPTPVSGIVAAADPLAYLTPPGTGGACLDGTVKDPPGGGGGKGGGGGGGTGPQVLNPGNYCTGISVSGKKDVVLNAGTYVITGGGVDFGGSGTVTGTGVTFYFAATGDSITFHGKQTIKLTAPTTGNYAGILFYQNQANATAATLDGANGSKFEGALYFPGAPLTINGAAGSTSAYMIVVVKSVTLNGATLNLPADYSGLAGGSPIKDAVLVE